MTKACKIFGILAVGVATGFSARTYAGDLPDAVQSRVLELMRDADVAGLPSERLLVKAQEGAAKGIPAERILAVLSTMSMKMKEAAAILDGVAPRRLEPQTRRALVGDLVAAQQLGIENGSLHELAKIGIVIRNDPKALRGSVVALADFAALGDKSSETQDLVKLALEQGFAEPEFPKLVRALRDLADSVGHDDAVKTLRAIVASGRRPDWAGAGGMGPERGPPPGVGKNGHGATKAKHAEPQGKK